jgi:LPXTG-motif cell wall-anchored protein
MKTRNFAFAASTLALALATLVTPGRAQGPLYDMVYVNLPYTVTIGDKVLQPGDYVIKELPSQDKSRVLLIYGNNGMTFETSSMTIPAYKVETPDSTTVVLHHFANDYYFDRIWIQGKNYGYEFPLPNSVKQREKEALAPVSVAARYQTAPAPQPTAAAPPPEPQPEVAQAAPPPAPEAAPEPAPAPAPEVIPAPTANRELPATSANWLLMLLSGGSLSGLGLMLRRKR